MKLNLQTQQWLWSTCLFIMAWCVCWTVEIPPTYDEAINIQEPPASSSNQSSGNGATSAYVILYC